MQERFSKSCPVLYVRVFYGKVILLVNALTWARWPFINQRQVDLFLGGGLSPVGFGSKLFEISICKGAYITRVGWKGQMITSYLLLMTFWPMGSNRGLHDIYYHSDGYHCNTENGYVEK